jgi:hypothetical protein
VDLFIPGLIRWAGFIDHPITRKSGYDPHTQLDKGHFLQLRSGCQVSLRALHLRTSPRGKISEDVSFPKRLNWLVVEPPTPLKNDGRIVSWDDFPFPTEWENKVHVPVTTNRLNGLVTTLLRKLHKGGSHHISWTFEMFCLELSNRSSRIWVRKMLTLQIQGYTQYPLVNIQKAIENGHRQFVDLPIKNGGSFHSKTDDSPGRRSCQNLNPAWSVKRLAMGCCWPGGID